MNLRSAAIKKLCSWLVGFALSLAAPVCAFAQCAMCKTSAENMDPAGVKYLNVATLLLLTPPVALFCGFFYLAYRHRAAPRADLGREAGRDEPLEIGRD